MENKTKPFGCIGIVGLGLIGGSLGLDLQSLGWNVHGLVHRETTLKRAKARRLAQVVSTDAKILADCDLVIIALPLENLLRPSAELINALPESAVITDVGSVKEPVLNLWKQLHPKFVASHPMAGTNNSGVESGQLGLFRQRAWVTTPDNETDPKALEMIHQLATALESHWITANAKKHDQAVALISHLPVLISAALLRTIGKEHDKNIHELAKLLASSGFSDTTRVGGGNPELGTAMAANNTSSVLQSLSSYRESLDLIEEAILSKNWQLLNAELEQTKTIRSSFLKKKTD